MVSHGLLEGNHWSFSAGSVNWLPARMTLAFFGGVMPVFARSFVVEGLEKWNSAHPGNAVRSLFDRWAMPGRPSTHQAPLRLGLRDGYVNFYVKGQSVAKLSCGRTGPRISVHQAYADQGANGDGDHNGMPPVQHYVNYRADALASPETAALIPGWIAKAERYANAEKRFVDRLIEANAGVIDLEMGLPAGDVEEGEPKTAPRMDLIVAQVPDEEQVSIAFWEAKCSNNSELRARADYAEADGEHIAGPKVIHQLRKYANWMRGGDRLGEVQRAYKAATGVMLGFYRVFGSTQVPQPDCVGIWEALAVSSMPRVILPPGVVVGNYCPAGHEPSKPEEARLFGRLAKSFPPHRKRLTDYSITVHEVESDLAGHQLPLLSPA
jgi:hypothetical protein